MKVIINSPVGENFNVPEGAYRVVLKEAFEVNKPGKTEKSARLKFKVLTDNLSGQEYFVGKGYPKTLALGSELRIDLESWLGREGYSALATDGVIDLDRLIGHRADVYVTNIYNDGYDAPFVHIAKIAPEGTLTGPNRSHEPPNPAPSRMKRPPNN